MINRQRIVGHDDALGRLCPFQTVDPFPMRSHPVPTAIVQAPAKEQFPQPMPTPLEILARVIPHSGQIADGFFLQRRGPHPRQQDRPQQLGQLAGITPIGLHALARLPRHERRRDHLTAHARRRDLPLQRVPARARFVTDADRAGRVSLELAR